MDKTVKLEWHKLSQHQDSLPAHHAGTCLALHRRHSLSGTDCCRMASSKGFNQFGTLLKADGDGRWYSEDRHHLMLCCAVF